MAIMAQPCKQFANAIGQISHSKIVIVLFGLHQGLRYLSTYGPNKGKDMMKLYTVSTKSK